MYSRANSPVLSRVPGRQVVRQIHWRASAVRSDWISALLAARISARCAQARERNIRLMQGRSGRCG